MFRFFIKNPVFSSVIAIIIVLCGLAAILSLPLAEYPNITPPTITISAHYPGANAKVLERTVASPIEDQINGSTQMIYMNSTMSSNGDYNLVITFATGTNLNDVIGDVLNRLNSALPILPQIVQQLGVTMRKSSQNLLMSIAMKSDGHYDNIYLSNYVYRSIYTELTRIKGVGDIQMTGARTYSMRVWLKPDIMAKLGISINDIQQAIKDQNIQVAVGKTGYPPTDGKQVLSFNLNGPGYYSTPEQFANIIIRANGNSYIRIKDIARVELGAQSYDTMSKLNEKENIGLQIYLDPSANQLQVHSLVLDAMQKLSNQFPNGISYEISFDNTKFVERALENVFATLRDACILVIIVVFLFLQKGKATLIPILTIPVSIIGTFAGMLVTGFSINNLTLFGLILSIGIVVDDSIVVIENVERIMHERGLSARDASIETMKEVASALIAIVLVLCCAFIPSAFLGGLTGILYRQFAITISIAVIISGITALTLTPALCAIMLKNVSDFKVKNKFFIKFNDWFQKITDQYVKAVSHVIKHRIKYMFVFGGLIIATSLIFIFIPKGFIPNEDKGYFMTQITLPNNASLARTEKVTDRFVNYMLKNKSVQNVVSTVGIDVLNSSAQKTNVSSITSNLQDWSDRDHNVNDLISYANKYGGIQKNARFISYNQPAIDGISSTNGVEFYIEDKVEGNYDNLQQYLLEITNKLKQDPDIKDAYFNFNAYTTEVRILADVDRAKMYGVGISDIYNTLETNFGPNLVNYFYKMGSLFWVTMQGDSKYRRDPFSLNNLYVKNESGSMVPLDSITTTAFANAPEVIERFNDYLGAKIVVDPKHGITIHEIMDKIQDACDKILPRSYSFSWYGVSFQQQEASSSAYIAFLFGLVMIFLVLAAQFEMWRLPIVVIMGVPFALFGAGLILLIRGLTSDLYFQISLITLLGLSAKNSILITEFALEHCKAGKSVIEGVLLASGQRFRPIIMTSLAFILGALPLAFASGANSNAEHSVGTGIIGGMLGSTFIATIFVPMFFVVIIGKKDLTSRD
ncbi:MAG: efflux RND transporter permease subunit [Neisseriaceae bacterium]